MALVMATAAFSTPQPKRRYGHPKRVHKMHCEHTDRACKIENGSILTLNMNELVIDGNDQTNDSGVVTLNWTISDDVNPLDWIGLYSVGEKNPFRYIDYRSGLRCRSSGQLQWKINSALFGSKNHCRIRFKYYDGLNGNLRAVSDILSLILINNNTGQKDNVFRASIVSNDSSQVEAFINLTVKEIVCENLRKSIIPQQICVHVALMKDENGHPSPSDCFKTRPSPSGQLHWRDLVFEYKQVSMCSSNKLCFVIKDKNRPRFYKCLARGCVSTLEILHDYQRNGNSSTQDEITFNVDMNVAKFTSSPSPSRTSVANNGRKSTCKLRVVARFEIIATNARGTNSASNSNNSFAELNPYLGSSSLLSSMTNMQQLNTVEAAFGTTSSVSSFSSASSNESACNKCGLHGIPNSDSGISHSSNDQQQQAIQNKVHNNEEPSTSTIPATNQLQRTQTSIYRVSKSRTPRPRSLPHTPIKSPRLKRPQTLDVVCSFCLSNANANVNLDNRDPQDEQNKPTLAMVLKNKNPVQCSRCAELRARWILRSNKNGSSEEGARSCSSFGSNSTSSSMSSKKQLAENYVDGLPPFWEARIDSHGRIFYIDHMNKTTTWERPRGHTANRLKQIEEARRQLMDKRYISMRKTVGSAVGRIEVPEGDFSKWPAVIFLTRPDFMMFLHNNDTAKEIYCTSQSVRHIIHRVRKDATKFERYQYNKDMVSLLNEFADRTAEMPIGWEMKIDHHAREVFVDHKNKRTTFIDPRLPMPTMGNRRKRARSAPSEMEEHVEPELTYNERVVNFTRKPDAMDIMYRRYENLRKDSKLRRKINTICKVGVPALKKYANDVDLITLLSLCEDHILADLPASKSPQVQDEFDIKLAEFYERLQQKGYAQGPGKLRLSMRREHILKDAFEQVMACSRKDLQRNKLNVVFDDEEGLDYGGPSREFFFLISRELFNPYYGLFEYSANDTYTVQISAMSIFVDNFIEWFQFCGRILGLALIHRYLLDTFFTRAFYKFLLRVSCSVSDLEGLDSQFYASLLWLQENLVTSELGLTFSVNEEVGGELIERDLKLGGSKIAVCEENKLEYIERIVKWRLERGVKKQASSLLRGFYEVIDPQLIRMFDARELELVLAGTIEIDIGDWRINTEYRGGYHDDHIAILWFWQAVEKFTNAQRLLLLQFVTGTSSIPYEGFAALRGSHGPKRFTIEKWGCPDGLPRAHTCFNRLDLPPYTSFATLNRKLLIAIEESSSFAIE